jgi:hypothetical protein
MELEAGSALRFDTRTGRQATAYVVVCQPLDNGQTWRLGARLDHPENLWGLESCPEDWQVLDMLAPEQHTAVQKFSSATLVPRRTQGRSSASQAFLDKIEEQLSEERLRGILAKLVRPLQGEVTEIREKLSRSTKQNRFEVSLGQIPPELEEKLWERLRKDLGAQALQQAREQSAELLESAKNTIDQKTGEGLVEFRNRLSGELHAVQRRAQALTKELTSATQQQVNAGIEKLQHEALDAGADLNAQAEKLLEVLQRRLTETHELHRNEIRQMQADAAAKASQLQSEVTALERQIAVLNESVRRLECDLDAHLETVAAEIVAGAKTQFEADAATALKELRTQGGNEVDARVDEACGHLRTIQNRIENSFSGSLKTQGEEAAQAVARQFDELAQQSVEKWRQALARDLSAAAKTLSQQLRSDLEE